MFATVEVETEDVLTLKVAEFCPDGIVTLPGVGVAAVESLDSVTVTPGAVATVLSVTVPDAVPPPIIEATDRVTPPTGATSLAPGRRGANRQSIAGSKKIPPERSKHFERFNLANAI